MFMYRFNEWQEMGELDRLDPYIYSRIIFIQELMLQEDCVLVL